MAALIYIGEHLRNIKNIFATKYYLAEPDYELSPMPESDIDFNNPAEVATLVRRTDETPVRLEVRENSMSSEAYDSLDEFMGELEEIVHEVAKDKARHRQGEDGPICIEIEDVEKAARIIRSVILRETQCGGK